MEAEEAKATVARLAGLGVDHVKIRSALSVEVYRAIAAAATEAGLALVGHAPEQVVPLLDCARAGQRSVEHTSFTVGPSMLGPDDLEDVISALKESGTVLVPTLVADQSYRLTDDAALRAHLEGRDDSPLRASATPQMLAFWRAQLAMKRFEGPIDSHPASTKSASAATTPGDGVRPVSRLTSPLSWSSASQFFSFAPSPRTKMRFSRVVSSRRRPVRPRAGGRSGARGGVRPLLHERGRRLLDCCQRHPGLPAGLGRRYQQHDRLGQPCGKVRCQAHGRSMSAKAAVKPGPREVMRWRPRGRSASIRSNTKSTEAADMLP